MHWTGKQNGKQYLKNGMDNGIENEKVASKPYYFNVLNLFFLKIHFLLVSLLLGKFNNV